MRNFVRRPDEGTSGFPRCGAARAVAGREPGLLSAGERMLAPAARLLARLGAPLLTVARAHADPEETLRLFAWTRLLEPGEETAWNPTWPELAELRMAGVEALRQVSFRWPAYAVPPVIGLVTDGTGLAISGEHPSGLSRNWLLDQIERRSSASIIIPFETSGVWSLLASDVQGPARPTSH